MDCGGCIREAEHEIIDCGCDMASPVTEVPPLMDFDFFPNPTRDVLTVEIAAEPGVARSLELRTLSGKLVSRWSAEGLTRRQLELPRLPAGVYLLTLISKDRELVTRRVVVE
jgi:hypothetical protein